MEKFYITTSIDYVNGSPHIGHALEKVQADAAARFARLQNKDVFFLIGTDEHGAKIATAAAGARKSVAKFTDSNAKIFKELWETLNISNDYFIRTTNKTKHWPAVKKVWKQLEKSGDIYKKEYEGIYCLGHEAFVTKKDLKNGKCQLHGTKPKLIQEENYFFKLSKYSKQIKKAIKSGNLQIVPKQRENEIMNLLDKGLEDVSFSRPRKDLKWGVPVPGDKTQTIYVWADALTNYISALDWDKNGAKFKKYWPADVHVIGKDILRFHAAIWPGMLLSLKLPLPKKLFVHGFINIEGQKISKSLGNVVDPAQIADEYSTDALRWYLLAEIPSTKDGDYSVEKFEARYNGDLALGLGNLLARITGLGEKHLDKPLKSELSATAKKELEKRWKDYNGFMEELKFSEAIKQAQALIAYSDQRINKVKLWELARDNKEKFEKEISEVATLLASVACMLQPIIPETSKKIFKQLGIDSDTKTTWKFTMKKGQSLFPRLP